MRNKYILLSASLMAVLFCSTSCSSDSVVEEPEPPKQESNDPMRFTSYNAAEQVGTRAAGTSLTQGFLVSCWKDFAGSGQQTVMDKYEVQYQTNDWYGTSAWNYIGDANSSTPFYQNQVERYWDYNKFPYRFHAITPCPDHSAISGFTVSGTQLNMPNSVKFSSQTATDGVLSMADAVAEPFLVAQVHRDANGKDTDQVMKDDSGQPLEINTSGTTLNRSVALPFHHITSKVRFGIYCTDEGAAQATDDMKIADVSIKAISAGFVTDASGYTANLTTNTMMQGTFGSKTTTDTGVTLISDSGDTSGKSIKDYNSQAKAYMCQVPGGLLQMPQQNVKLTVTLTIGSVTYVDEPVVLVNPDNTTSDVFTWDPNTIYTYYIALKRFTPKGIEFTCSLVPWTDISGSLTTDLEQ